MSTGLGKYSYRFKPLRVYVDGALASGLNVKVIRRSAGGSRVDAVELERTVDGDPDTIAPLRRTGLGFDGAALPVVEITTSRNRVLYAGKLSPFTVTLDSNVEHLQYLVRQENHCFGDPVGFLPCYRAMYPASTSDAGGGFGIREVHRPLVFNPLIDGQVRGNRAAARRVGPAQGGHFVFLEYDSVRTPRAASTTWRSSAVEWSLKDIVHYLCWILNPGQDFVLNPTAPQLAARGMTPERVRNFAVEHGDYLPDVLDSLLTPRGFSWFVRCDGLGRRRLEFFRRGVGIGAPAVFDIGRAGGVLDPAQHNAPGTQVKYDPASVANRVRITGARRQYEVTVELVRCWSASQDSLSDDVTQLRKSDDNLTFDAVRDVWRKFALNEAGDYTGLRSEITSHFDLSSFLGGQANTDLWVPRRREFLPCITRGTDEKPIGQKHGCVVEFWALDGDAGHWKAADDGMVCHLAQDECAVYFGGEMPPEELMNAGAAAKVRITATLESDAPLVSRVASSSFSPTADRIPMTLDLSDQFHYREVTVQSQFYSDVNNGTFQHDQINDSAAIEAYAALVLDSSDFGRVNGTIRLEGVDKWPVELGQPVKSLRGRELNFNGRVLGTPKYPTIVGISYDVDAQATYVTLETFRKHMLPEIT